MPLDLVWYSEYPLGAALESTQAALGEDRFIFPMIPSPSDAFLATANTWVAEEWNAAADAARIIPILAAVPFQHRCLFLNYPMHGGWNYADPAELVEQGPYSAEWRAWFTELASILSEARMTPSRVIFDQERSIATDFWDSADAYDSPGFADAMAAIQGSAECLAAMALIGSNGEGAAAAALPGNWHSTDPFSETWLAQRETWNEFAAAWLEHYHRLNITATADSHFPNCRTFNFGDRAGYGVWHLDVNDRTIPKGSSGGASAPVVYLPAAGASNFDKAYQVHRAGVNDGLVTGGPAGTFPVYSNPSRGTNEYAQDGNPDEWKRGVTEDVLTGARRGWFWNAKPAGATAGQIAIIEADELTAAAHLAYLRADAPRLIRLREVRP